MQRLAQEGKPISRILAEDFPQLDYWDVYEAVYASGERSSRGIKRMITSRLNVLVGTQSKRERDAIVAELQDLVWHLYENHKKNQKKLAAIRKTLQH